MIRWLNAHVVVSAANQWLAFRIVASLFEAQCNSIACSPRTTHPHASAAVRTERPVSFDMSEPSKGESAPPPVSTMPSPECHG